MEQNRFRFICYQANGNRSW